MEGGEKLSLEQIRAFLTTSQDVQFEGKGRREIYGFIGQVLRYHDYERVGRRSKGLLKQYLAKMTGMSRAQLTRLIGTYQQGLPVEPCLYRREKFTAQYTAADIELLAQTDEAHESMSGPATQKILYREFYEFGNKKYERLANISSAHLYRLRKTRTYRNRFMSYQPTRPVQITIGERRRPDPQGLPGYIRIDTVHQGDLDGQ